MIVVTFITFFFVILQIKRLIDDDPRYDAIDSSSDREQLFRDYCKKLEAEDEEAAARKEEARKQREKRAR